MNLKLFDVAATHRKSDRLECTLTCLGFAAILSNRGICDGLATSREGDIIVKQAGSMFIYPAVDGRPFSIWERIGDWILLRKRLVTLGIGHFRQHKIVILLVYQSWPSIWAVNVWPMFCFWAYRRFGVR